MEIDYKVGDALNPECNKPYTVVHICNNIGAWGGGFTGAISAKWAKPETDYRAMAHIYCKHNEKIPLGNVQFVVPELGVTIANLIGQDGCGWNDGPPIRYNAVRKGLKAVRNHLWLETEPHVIMPRIGCGLAGGKWEEIEPIIQKELCKHGIRVTVYDLPKEN